MAKVILKEPRELESSYHLHRQPSHAPDIRLVRRKVAMPTDYEHKGSRETQDQRKRFASAARRWASLPPPIKAELARKYGIIWRHHSPGLSEKDVLEGMQLFMSQEIHAQEYHQKHTPIPPWVCVQTIEPLGKILPFHPDLYYELFQPAFRIPRYPLAPGNTFYYPIPETEYAYAFSRDNWYIWKGWSPSWKLQELLKLRQIVVLPELYERGYRPYNWQTTADDPNWKYLAPVYPNAWWRVNVHEYYGSQPQEYYPYAMAQFTFDQLATNRLKINILPLAFHYKTEFKMIYSPPNPLYWTVTVPSPGQWSLSPNKQNVIIEIPSGKIIEYQG